MDSIMPVFWQPTDETVLNSSILSSHEIVVARGAYLAMSESRRLRELGTIQYFLLKGSPFVLEYENKKDLLQVTTNELDCSFLSSSFY